MSRLAFELHAAPGVGLALADHLGCPLGRLSRRSFPDGETYLRFDTPVEGEDVILICTLDHPDTKLAVLLIAADALRQQKARSVGLVAPYLAYMRQDTQFRAGEAVTSRTIARLLSSAFDWLVTVDPHLHRYPKLDAVYSVPAVAVSASSKLAGWIAQNVTQPVLVGPDEESAQWVERIARLANAPFTTFRKQRSGDYSVRIESSGLEHLREGTAVLVDDIASSARTLIEAADQVRNVTGSAPVCAIVHPIFAGDSYQRLLASGVSKVVSTNTVPHLTNQVDVTSEMAEAILRAEALADGRPETQVRQG